MDGGHLTRSSVHLLSTVSLYLARTKRLQILLQGVCPGAMCAPRHLLELSLNRRRRAKQFGKGTVLHHQVRYRRRQRQPSRLRILVGEGKRFVSEEPLRHCRLVQVRCRTAFILAPSFPAAVKPGLGRWTRLSGGSDRLIACSRAKAALTDRITPGNSTHFHHNRLTWRARLAWAGPALGDQQ